MVNVTAPENRVRSLAVDDTFVKGVQCVHAAGHRDIYRRKKGPG